MSEEQPQVFKNVIVVSAKAYVKNEQTPLVRLDGNRERFELPETLVEIHEQRVLRFRLGSRERDGLELDIKIELYPGYMVGSKSGRGGAA